MIFNIVLRGLKMLALYGLRTVVLMYELVTDADKNKVKWYVYHFVTIQLRP